MLDRRVKSAEKKAAMMATNAGIQGVNKVAISCHSIFDTISIIPPHGTGMSKGPNIIYSLMAWHWPVMAKMRVLGNSIRRVFNKRGEGECSVDYAASSFHVKQRAYVFERLELQFPGPLFLEPPKGWTVTYSASLGLTSLRSHDDQ